MIIWLLVLLLLIGFIYVVYRMNFMTQEIEEEYDEEQHYTFKL